MSENYLGIMSGNYQWELSSENYDLVYNITWLSHGKVEIYRDTGVSKKNEVLSIQKRTKVTKFVN